MDYLKEFISKLQNLDYSKRIFSVFEDFLTLSTCSLVQTIYRSDEIEQKYLKTINKVIDIDETCFMMSYIQLSLLGIPARVMLGDSLAWKFSKVLYTPFYYLSGFEWKLKQRNSEELKEVKIYTNQETKVLQLSLLTMPHFDIVVLHNKNKRMKHEIFNTSKQSSF